LRYFASWRLCGNELLFLGSLESRALRDVLAERRPVLVPEAAGDGREVLLPEQIRRRQRNVRIAAGLPRKLNILQPELFTMLACQASTPTVNHCLPSTLNSGSQRASAPAGPAATMSSCPCAAAWGLPNTGADT
jgi:hypothetical protein